MSKQAFLVLAPESSGGRFVTQRLIDAGCYGDAGHEQRLDLSFAGAGDCVVWRRSLPYGKRWPELDGMLNQLRDNGYETVRVIVVVRDHTPCSRSQVERQFASNEDEAARRVTEALMRIGFFVQTNRLPARVITFESLLRDFDSFVMAMKSWGLTIKPTTMVDANAKHLMKDPSPADVLGLETPDPAASITQVANWYYGENAEEHRRLERARDSWNAQIALDGHWSYREPSRHRSSKDLGDSRVLPFVKDMLDRACEDSDIGVLTNSDVLLNDDAGKMIREHCTPCCYSHRMDIAPDGKELRVYPGIDLVAVQSRWWKEHRDEYPDFVIGCEGWDGVMSMWLDHVNPQAELARPIIQHEVHQNFWSKPENVMDNIGQRWNRSLATLWLIQNGRQSRLGSGTCLIKPRKTSSA